MPVNSRGKGARGEREVIDLLQAALDEVAAELGKVAPRLERNLEQVRHGGHDLVGIDFVQVEVKRVENDAPGLVKSWWEQAKAASAKFPLDKQMPVLIHRKNNQPWKVRMFGQLPLASGQRVCCPVDISFDAFVVWFKLKAREVL